MNYIQEINSFHKYMSIKPLAGSTQSLWFLLMDINNKCLWIDWFKVSNMRLANALRMSEKTLIKHRDILVENGLIFYKSHRRKKDSGEYNMLSVSVCFRKEIEANETESTVKITVDSENETESTVKITVDSENETESTVKITVDEANETESTVKITVDDENEAESTVKITVDDKTTVKITDIDKQVRSISTTTIKSESSNQDLENIEKFFSDNFYLIGSYETNQFKKWLIEFNSDVILLALEEAVKKGIKNYKYIEGILKNWLPLDLKTVDEINAHMESFSSKQNVSKFEKVTPISKKNKFHNFTQRENKYTNEELEIKLGIRK